MPRTSKKSISKKLPLNEPYDVNKEEIIMPKEKKMKESNNPNIIDVPTEESQMSPAEYFESLKGKKETMTDEKLAQVYDNAMILMKRYKITGQKLAMKKLAFYIDKLEKERELVKLGFCDYIYKDAIEDYIDNIADGVVKIVELENYERDLPDSVIDIVEKVNGIFTNLYVIFTDYTGRVERKVKAHRREKDPILVGGFMNRDSMGLSDRLYLLADWIDPYCDLTLEKMITEIKMKKGKAPIHQFEIPETLEEMKKDLGSIRSENGTFINGAIDTSDGNWGLSNESSYISVRTDR